jgi:hypothetical protein
MIRKNYGLFLKTDAVVGILAKSFLTLKNSLTSTLYPSLIYSRMQCLRSLLSM